MPNIFHIKKYLLLAVMLSLSACASTPDSIVKLDDIWKNYEKAMLWGEYSYVMGAHKGKPISDLVRERLKHIKVTSYEVMNRKVVPDGTAATQRVHIKYYNKAYAVVREITVAQDWAYDEKSEQWFILSPFPKFK
ncbi:MAG: hypothetical protein OEZ33_05985 [Gammaproteobacteria bacterium]|nr:hypothetical protein [Gammaproteobacteria bacterium]MDH5777740.1 hypothetical protein [Gammaproteobacteria bacterium]